MGKGLIQPLPSGPLDIVGDVHGEVEALDALLRELGYDANAIQTLENGRTQEYRDLHARYGAFGNTYNASHVSEVTLARSLAFGGGAQGAAVWVGNVVTTFNQ